MHSNGRTGFGGHSPFPSFMQGGMDASPSYQDLLRENRLLHTVIDNFPGGILLYDNNLRLVLCNAKQREMLDYPPALFEFGLPSLEQIFRFNAIRGEYGPGDIEEHVRDRMRLAARREAHVFERTRPNGTVLQIRGVPLECGGFLTMYLDVTGERRAMTEAAPQPEAPAPGTPPAAITDAVTGLPSWALFQDRFGQVLARVRRGHIAAIHLLSLDRYRQVLDQLGPRVAEGLLKGVSLRLVHAARATDTVIPYGEDAFIILQSEVDRPASVARLSQRVVSAIRQPFEISNYEISLDASIGLALIPRDGTDIDGLIGVARTSLQRARSGTAGSGSVNDDAAPVFRV